MEFAEIEDLAFSRAKNDNKIVIYEYNDYYCEPTVYNNFAFIDEPNNFDELCEHIFNYLIKTGNFYSTIEVESYFEDKAMKFRINSDSFVKLINFVSNSSLSFIGMDEYFETKILTLKKNKKSIKKYEVNKYE